MRAPRTRTLVSSQSVGKLASLWNAASFAPALLALFGEAQEAISARSYMQNALRLFRTLDGPVERRAGDAKQLGDVAGRVLAGAV